MDRRQQPRLSRGGERFDFLRFRVSERDRVPCRGRSEGFDSRWFGAFFNPHPVVDRQIVKFLHQSARPANRSAHRPFAAPKPKKTSLLCCERNPDPACNDRTCNDRPGAQFSFYRDDRADGVAVLFVPRRWKAMDGGRLSMTFFKTATADRCGSSETLPDVRHGRSPRAQTPGRLPKSPVHHGRNIGERSIAIVRVENISLVAAPRAIRPD